MKRNHAAEVSALTAVVTTAVNELGVAGCMPAEPTREALACVERWVAGEPVTADELEHARAAAHGATAKGTDAAQERALDWANAAVGNLAFMASKARGWQNGERSVMDAAHYMISSLRTGETGIGERLETCRVLALERALASATLPKAPKAAVPPVGGKARRIKGELAPFIGNVACARLSTLKAIVDPARRGDDAALRALLADRQYPVHEPVLAFERRYGGLVMPEAPGSEGTDWSIGAFACLASDEMKNGAASALVPVAYSPNDVIYFLDEAGTAWAQDTLEDPSAIPFACDGDRMVARILLFQIAFERRFSGAVKELEGKRGEEVAAALTLPFVKEASDEIARVWADGRTVVIEQQPIVDAPWQTLIASRDKKKVQGVAQKN